MKLNSVVNLWPPFSAMVIVGPFFAIAAEAYCLGATETEAYPLSAVAAESLAIGAVATEAIPE